MKQRPLAFIKELFRRFQEDEVSALAAQMTYYLLLAFFPFLIFLLTLISYTPVTSADILNNLNHLVADESYQIVKDFVDEFLETDNKTLLSFGMIGALWASSTGVAAIIRGLNKAYDVEESRPFWKARGLSLIFTIALGIVVLLSFVLLIFGKAIGEQVFIFLHFPDHFDLLWNVMKYGILLIIMLVVFVFIYKITPNRHLTIREVFPGAVFSIMGWIFTSLLFSFYVNNFGNYSAMYGSIGGIIILLIWLYISSIILLLGGEINATITFLKTGEYKPVSKKYS